MAANLTQVVIDSRDPHTLAAFWSSVLGWPVLQSDEDNGELEEEVEIGPSTGAIPTLLFSRGPDDKVTKNRLHLDLRPAGVSQDEELKRLLDLGAHQIDIGQGDQTWYVLADPEGNEFCLLRAASS